MAELIVEEFDVCHKFVGYMSYLLPLNQRDHVSVQYVVGARSFTIFLSFDKFKYNDMIENFIMRIILESRKYGLCKYGWNTTKPSVVRVKNNSYEKFADCYQIDFSVLQFFYSRKKKKKKKNASSFEF